MSKVWRVSGVTGQVYYRATGREADRVRPGGDLPEIVSRVDAAAECTELHEAAEAAEREVNELRHLLAELYDAAGAARFGTAGQRAASAIRKFNPGAADAMGIPDAS